MAQILCSLVDDKKYVKGFVNKISKAILFMVCTGKCMQASSQFLFTEKICRAYHGLKRYRFNLLNPRFVSFEVFQQ